MTVTEQQSTDIPDQQPMDLSTPIVHDVLEAAQWLRCGRSTVYDLMTAGELISIKIGRRRLVTHDSLVKFVQRAAAASVSSA